MEKLQLTIHWEKYDRRFYQPRAVIADLDTLKTLAPDEFRCGLAEVVKYGVIEDPDLFTYLEEHVDSILGLDADCLAHLIQTSCAIKAKVVEKMSVSRITGWS